MQSNRQQLRSRWVIQTFVVQIYYIISDEFQIQDAGISHVNIIIMVGVNFTVPWHVLAHTHKNISYSCVVGTESLCQKWVDTEIRLLNRTFSVEMAFSWNVTMHMHSVCICIVYSNYIHTECHSPLPLSLSSRNMFRLIVCVRVDIPIIRDWSLLNLSKFNSDPRFFRISLSLLLILELFSSCFSILTCKWCN